MTTPAQLTIHRLTPERWSDLERLFGPRGAYGGYWCMWWRISRAEFDAQPPPASSFMGTPSLDAQAGFTEVAKPSDAP